jgi:hypothetical protein
MVSYVNASGPLGTGEVQGRYVGGKSMSDGGYHPCDPTPDEAKSRDDARMAYIDDLRAERMREDAVEKEAQRQWNAAMSHVNMVAGREDMLRRAEAARNSKPRKVVPA